MSALGQEVKNMGIFDEYKGDMVYEDLPSIKSKSLLNVPFTIEKMVFKNDMESDFGAPRPVMITTIAIKETGERFVYYAENTVVLKKLAWLQDEKINFKDAVFKLIYVEGAANKYFDIVEA